MASNVFNTGRDVSLVIIHPLAPNGRLDLPMITDFDAKPSYHDITSNSLDGYTRTAHIPQNIPLSFTADRSNSAVDDFCSAMWQQYRTTGRVPDGTVYQYVSEIDGSTTTLQYSGVAFKPDDFGNWKKESAVSQKITGTAMDYTRVS